MSLTIDESNLREATSPKLIVNRADKQAGPRQ